MEKEYQQLLKKANADLKQECAMLFIEEEDNTYRLDIHYQNGERYTYADGYYENELDELIHEAKDYVKEHSHLYDNRTAHSNKLNNFERHTFDIVKKEIDELGVPLDKSWTLTWKKEYSQEVGQDLSTCTIMEGDKQVYKTNVHDDVSLACLEIQAFIEGVKAVLAIEQEGSIEADLKR